ncbi:substrate-binding periplasmic protein [Pseudomonas guineae]|uniref:substrate-binding periplasmic protein n=1 Tax=Pseudomonas guineae TaxID=425504 RepID=UPI0030EB18B9
MHRLLILIMISCSSLASADELRWGFASADGMPYVDVREQQLHGGFIYELGQRVSQQLGYQAAFVETPNKRIDEYMQRGRIHVICNNTPQWIDNPERYHWSAPLYSEEDVLLVHRQQAPINSLQDLYGKNLGTQLGYVYNSALMDAFATQRINRKNLRDHTVGFNLLRKQRLDAIIGMRRTLRFQMNKQANAPLRINTWVIERYDMHCTYSPQLPVSAERLDKILLQLRDQGLIKQLLNDS